jgi:hypothetical protein
LIRPAFRTVAETVAPLEIVEPAYYHKVVEDYGRTSPEPYILRFDMSPTSSNQDYDELQLQSLLDEIKSLKNKPRVVIELFDSSSRVKPVPTHITAWAEDTANSWSRGLSGELMQERVDPLKYLYLPRGNMAQLEHPSLAGLHICKSFLHYVKSNRTCFDKC